MQRPKAAFSSNQQFFDLFLSLSLLSLFASRSKDLERELIMRDFLSHFPRGFSLTGEPDELAFRARDRTKQGQGNR